MPLTHAEHVHREGSLSFIERLETTEHCQHGNFGPSLESLTVFPFREIHGRDMWKKGSKNVENGRLSGRGLTCGVVNCTLPAGSAVVLGHISAVTIILVTALELHLTAF